MIKLYPLRVYSPPFFKSNEWSCKTLHEMACRKIIIDVSACAYYLRYTSIANSAFVFLILCRDCNRKYIYITYL